MENEDMVEVEDTMEVEEMVGNKDRGKEDVRT